MDSSETIVILFLDVGTNIQIKRINFIENHRRVQIVNQIRNNQKTPFSKKTTIKLKWNKNNYIDAIYKQSKMQTRSGKSYTTSSSMEKTIPRVDTTVDNGGSKYGGFMQPRQISNELAKFLGKPVGTKMHRPEVSRGIINYINTNKLQDSENGRIIHADEKLRKLLKLGRNDQLTYFNLQSYLGPHFATA
jgi:chromatin remodeling complex protein RSC6